MTQIERYAATGVQHLVIEPAANDLDDFIEQMTQFARDVATPYVSAYRDDPQQ